jgi:hypothetical protein
VSPGGAQDALMAVDADATVIDAVTSLVINEDVFPVKKLEVMSLVTNDDVSIVVLFKENAAVTE